MVKFLNDARSPRLISNHTVGHLISATDSAAAAAAICDDASGLGQESPASAAPRTGNGDAAELFGLSRRGMGFINKLASKFRFPLI